MAVLDKLNLTGKVAIVTGAGRGLGRAIALCLAEAGADIVATARTRSQVEETADMVRGHGRAAEWVECDVTDSSSVGAMVQSAIDRFRVVDILVNNAGGATPGMQNTLVDIEDQHWRVGVDTNLTGAMYCSRAVIPQMLEQGSGKIINVTSGFGLRVARDNFIYTSAKAGLINFTRALALTYAPQIQANLIAPGLFPHDNPAMIEWWRGGKFVPMGRLGGDDEIGLLSVFLASGLTSYMNGQIVVLDGGGLAGGHAPTGFAPRVELPEAVA
ncbi:MAG TPA: SDR family oxidoreductase [Dehalococcoidia bacterium]|jgi:7-alpha-hydroxysteroid dehydrogenase|nr:SDR family oxidoreductase [Dehalococcoidia bacterium]